MNGIKLLIKINIFGFIYYLLFLKILVERFLLNLFSKSKMSPEASMMKYLNISIMNKLLTHSDLNKSEKIFSRSIIINYLTYKLALSYLKYLSSACVAIFPSPRKYMLLFYSILTLLFNDFFVLRLPDSLNYLFFS